MSQGATFADAMASSITAHASHTPTSTSSLHQAAVPALLPNNLARARVHTYTAHALVLFNVYGIPLSSGIWLEYYFTTLHPTTPLLTLSIIFAAQCACLSLAIGISTYLHTRSPRHWRWMMLTGALLVCSAHIGLLTNTNNSTWVLVLCQGGLTGLALGILCAVSTRVLSTHYQHSVALASRLCVSAGFAGASVYTVVVWCCLRTSRVQLANGMTLLLLGTTLVPALLLMEPSPLATFGTPTDAQLEQRQHPPPRKRICKRARKGWRKGRCTAPTLLALSIILPSILLPPLYIPLLLAHRPNLYRADASMYTLLILNIIAIFSSALTPRIHLSRVSARTLCGAASILTGTALIPLIWMRRLKITVPCVVVYGAGLEMVCTRWAEVAVECREGGVSPFATVFALVVGLCGAGAVVDGAAVLQGCEQGVEIVLGAVAGCLILGGLVVSGGDSV